MGRFLLQRIALAIAVAIAVSAMSFGLLHLTGDPALVVAGEAATARDIEAIRIQYGFDRPLLEQYFEWVVRAAHGDFGESYYFRQPVASMIFERLPTTLILGASAIAFALLMGLTLGVAAGFRPNSWMDRLALMVAVSGQAVPSFWLALILVILFAIKFPFLPVAGSETWKHFVLPTFVLGFYATPAIMRLIRAGMIETLSSDYVRTARAKGLRPLTIVLKHALRNAVLPVISLAAVQFGFMLSGSVVIETVFALNGMGYFAWEAINRSDLPIVQAIILIMAILYIGLTLAADLLNAWLDPRIRSV